MFLLEQAAVAGVLHWGHLNSRTWANVRTSRLRVAVLATEMEIDSIGIGSTNPLAGITVEGCEILGR